LKSQLQEMKIVYKRSAALLAAMALFLAFAGTAEDIAATLDVDYDGDGAADVTTEATLAENSTALDLLKATSVLDVEEMEWGTLVVGINGVMANWEEEGTWWMFTVDGEPAEVTVDKFVLEQGQTVTMIMAGAEEAEAHEAATNETATNETASSETATDDTATNETATTETAVDDTAANETATNETAADDTAANETATNETAADGAAANETAADEAAATS